MRTTIDIDADVLAAARSLARAERVSIGQVISRLARRGLAPRDEHVGRRGIPVFNVSEHAGPLTSEMVRRADDDA